MELHLKTKVRHLLRRFNISIHRYSHSTAARRLLLIRRHGVDLILDVGANTGQYALGLREAGYLGRIHSFEPLREAFEILQGHASHDSLWNCHRVALGDRDETRTFNVAGNSVSSSFLPMLARHIKAAPESRYIGSEQVHVRQLDSLSSSIVASDARLYLKLDVQGFEKSVLAGGRAILPQVRLIEMEMSLVPLYIDQPLLAEMISHLEELNFQLIWLDRGYEDDETGELLQVDGIFRRLPSSDRDGS